MRYITFLAALAFALSSCDHVAKKDMGANILQTTDTLILDLGAENGLVAAPAYFEDLKQQYMGVEMIPADLDSDGAFELIFSYYTGGAHCCDELEIFAQYGDVFKLEKHLYEAYLTENGQIELSFVNTFGYFNSCFACDVDIPHPQAVNSILANYRAGKLQPVENEKNRNAQIIENLFFLKEKSRAPMSAAGQDAGTRKAFLKCIAAYYFTNQRDMPEAKALFFTHYAGNDRTTVWQEIQREIREFESSSFQKMS